MKKIALALAMTMALSVPVYAEETVEKADVETTMAEAVEEKEDTEEKVHITYSPNKITYRLAVGNTNNVKVFTRVKERGQNVLDYAPDGDGYFVDLKGENAEYADAAYRLGTAWGIAKDGIFGPDETLTVEDTVSWLYRLAAERDKNGIVIPRAKEANGYAFKPLMWAVGMGLVDRDVDGKAPVTIEQLNFMLHKLGYESAEAGKDETITRIEGLKIILDSEVGEVHYVD